MWTRAAARPKCNSSATAMKYRRCRSSIRQPYHKRLESTRNIYWTFSRRGLTLLQGAENDPGRGDCLRGHVRAVRPDVASIPCDRRATDGMHFLRAAGSSLDRDQPRRRIDRCSASRSLADALTMGFYYGSTRRSLGSDDIGPIITPREYIRLLSGATRMVIS